MVRKKKQTKNTKNEEILNDRKALLTNTGCKTESRRALVENEETISVVLNKVKKEPQLQKRRIPIFTVLHDACLVNIQKKTNIDVNINNSK